MSSSIVSGFCTTTRMQLVGRTYENISVQAASACNNLYRGRISVRRTLQRLHRYVLGTWLHLPRRATPRTSAKWLIPPSIFYSLLAASICCHRDRHRCNAGIHACLQATRGLCLKADFNFCVRPSGSDAFVSLTIFLSFVFSVNFLRVFSQFFPTNCSSEPSRKNDPKTCFSDP